MPDLLVLIIFLLTSKFTSDEIFFILSSASTHFQNTTLKASTVQHLDMSKDRKITSNISKY